MKTGREADPSYKQKQQPIAKSSEPKEQEEASAATAGVSGGHCLLTLDCIGRPRAGLQSLWLLCADDQECGVRV